MPPDEFQALPTPTPVSSMGKGEVSRHIVTLVFTAEGQERIDTVVTKYRKLEDQTISMATTTETFGDNVTATSKTVYEYADAQDELHKRNQQNIRSMHHMNMSILGVNMSRLGLVFTFKNAALMSDEMYEKFVQIIAPIQVMMSAFNMATATVLIYNWAVDQGKQKMHQFYVAAGAIGFILMAIATTSKEARIVLIALAAAFGILTIMAWNATAAKLAAMIAEGPIGWVIAAVSAGLIAGVIALVATWQTQGLWTGGVAMRPMVARIAEHSPEAVIPLQSPRAKTMGIAGPGMFGGVTIQKAYINVRTDNPRRFLHETQRALKRKQFLT
jgi:hypothetical protein